MKYKPTIYAQALVAGLKNKSDLKEIARGLWYSLQKNNQYKDMAKILTELEVEYAKSENKLLARVYSETALSETEMKDIKEKIEKKSGSKIHINNILKKNWGGIEVVVEDKVIDLSSKGKIEKLKQTLTA